MVVENYSKGFQLAGRVYYLAILPFLLDLIFLTGRAIDTFSPNTVRLGFKFSFPNHFPTLTDFFNFPTTTGLQTIAYSFESLTISALLYILLLTVVVALVSSGYLGKMNAARLGESSRFMGNASRYFVRILIYDLFITALLFLGIFFGLAMPSLALLYILAFFIIYYLAFLTPFGIVIDDLQFWEALIRSKNLASTYVSKTVGYVIAYLILTAIISLPIYAIINEGFPGFLIALAISALAGTWLVASTMQLYVQITQPSTQPAEITPPMSSPPDVQPPL